MNDKNFTVRAEVEVNLTQQDIDDIMMTALDGGICYWCQKAEVVGKYLGAYAHEQIARGGALILHDAESARTWELTLDKFLNGMKLAIEQGIGLGINPADGSIDTCDIGADAADAIAQLALFGEVVFG